MKKILLLTIAIITLINCTPIYKKMNIDKDFYNGLQDGVYAKMETSKGELIIQFFDQDAPVTVANFVGLAQGTIENKAKAKGVPYYDGIVFHRVIKNFMIQGGDPQGTGMGDPGYKFDDEKNNLDWRICQRAGRGRGLPGAQRVCAAAVGPGRIGLARAQPVARGLWFGHGAHAAVGLWFAARAATGAGAAAARHPPRCGRAQAGIAGRAVRGCGGLCRAAAGGEQ